MPEQIILLPKEADRARPIARIAALLSALDRKSAWRVEIHEQRPTRSNSQNAYLWGVVYATILKAGKLEGWEPDDLHEYLLGEHFGWEVVEGFGRKKMRPLRRSAKLNKMEFADYIDFIQRRMAQMGIYVPDPGEQ